MEVKPYKVPHPFRKLTKELIDKICQDIKEGSTHKLASESNGITQRIFDIWRAQGVCDQEHHVESLCAYLVLALAKIKQSEVKWCRSNIKKLKKGHKGAEWTLEHAYWKEFGPSAAIMHLSKELDDITFKKFVGDYLNGKEELDQKSN